MQKYKAKRKILQSEAILCEHPFVVVAGASTILFLYKRNNSLKKLLM